MVGIEDDQLDAVVGIIKGICRKRQQAVAPVPPLGGTGEPFVPYPVKVTVGGAAIFVIDVEQFIRV